MKPAVVKKPGKLKSKRITRLLYGEKRPKNFKSYTMTWKRLMTFSESISAVEVSISHRVMWVSLRMENDVHISYTHFSVCV